MSKFITDDFKCITLMGMSGVGKSYTAAMLEKNSNWYHFSVDYLIGNYYLADQIPNYGEVTKEDITPITKYLGILGDPNKGGMDYKTLRRRQRLYHDSEVIASQALPEFIRIAKENGYPGLINDTAGSICELSYDELPEIISEHSLIIYIKASPEDEKAIFERAKSYPKPLLYRPEFLKEQMAEFLKENGLTQPEKMDPKAFFDWVFPRLFKQRLPRYQAIADKYGVTISSDAIKTIENADDLIALVQTELNKK
jgi:hypothetical protein